MNRNAFAIAHQAYLEAPYQAEYEQQDREEAAINEWWHQEAAAFVGGNPIGVLELEATETLVARAALFAPLDNLTVTTEAELGRMLVEIVREYMQANAKAIEARCIKRAEEAAKEVD